MTSAHDLRELNDDDLRNRERDLDDQIFRLRIQKSMGQLDAPLKLRELRRDLARVKTVLRERRSRRAGRAAASASGLSERVWLTKCDQRSGCRDQRQDGQERRGRGRAPGAARAVREDRSAGRRRSWRTTRGTRRRSGDLVEIVEGRPMSRRKRWVVTRIVRRAIDVRATRRRRVADVPGSRTPTEG